MNGTYRLPHHLLLHQCHLAGAHRRGDCAAAALPQHACRWATLDADHLEVWVKRR